MKRNKNKSHLAGRVLSGLAIAYKRIQNKWARFMERWTDRLSRRKLMAVMALFIVTTNTYCCILLFSSSKSEAEPSVQVKRISIPAAPLPKEPINKAVAGLKMTRRYLDSLASSAAGRKMLDSILSPGLLDTLEQIDDWKKLIK